jgi:hypothetical protein
MHFRPTYSYDSDAEKALRFALAIHIQVDKGNLAPSWTAKKNAKQFWNSKATTNATKDYTWWDQDRSKLKRLVQTSSLQGTYQLVRQHKHSFQGEFPATKVEQVFKTWPQQIKNQNIVVTLYPKPPDVWNSGCGSTVGWSRKSPMAQSQTQRKQNAKDQSLLLWTRWSAHFLPEGSCTAWTHITIVGALFWCSPAQAECISGIPVKPMNKHKINEPLTVTSLCQFDRLYS